MDLQTWIAHNKKTDQEVADAVGVTRPYIVRIRAGLVSPSLEVGLKIHNYTKRKVDLEQLLPRYMRPQPTQPALPATGRGRPRKPAAPKASKSPAAA